MRTLIIVMLIEVFGLCYFEMTFADITINGETVRVETDAYKVQFDRGVITRLHNKLTAETYTLPRHGRPTGGSRTDRHLKDEPRTHLGNTRESTLTEARKTAQDKAEILFRQGGNEITLNIEVEAHTGDLLIGGSGASDTAGVYGFSGAVRTWISRNLKLILPVDGGQVIDASSPIHRRRIQLSRDLGSTTRNPSRAAGRFFRSWSR